LGYLLSVVVVVRASVHAAVVVAAEVLPFQIQR